MKLHRTVSRLASAQDGEELRRAARDVGHELQRGRVSVLAEFRAALAGVKDAGGSEFVRGYREAILDLVAAYAADLKPSLDFAAAKNAVATKSYWADIVRCLKSGPATPTQIQQRLPISLSTVSRALAEMRTAQLVETTTLEGIVSDGRAKLHQLTSLGERVAEATTNPLADDLAAAMSAAVGVFALLATERSVWGPEFLRLFDRVPGNTGVREYLSQELMNAGLATKEGETLFAPELSVQNKVAAELDYSLRHTELSPAFMDEICKRLNPSVPEQTTLIVRSAKPAKFWDQYLQGRRFAKARTIATSDIWLDSADVRIGSGERVAVVYESLPVLFQDKKRWEAFSRLERQATWKFCLSSPAAQVPPGWTPVHVNP